MKIPIRYEDLTVYQLMELEALKSIKDIDLIDRAIKRLSILSGKDIDYLESLSPKEVFAYLEKASFLLLPIHSIPIKQTTRIGVRVFKPIKNLSEFTTVQNKDYSAFLEQKDGDYIACLPELLALIHKEYSIKNGWIYKQNNHFRNVELFKRAKLKDVIGAVFFYSSLWKHYSETLKDYLEQSQNIINETMTMIEKDQEFQGFLKSGAGNIQ